MHCIIDYIHYLLIYQFYQLYQYINHKHQKSNILVNVYIYICPFYINSTLYIHAMYSPRYKLVYIPRILISTINNIYIYVYIYTSTSYPLHIHHISKDIYIYINTLLHIYPLYSLYPYLLFLTICPYIYIYIHIHQLSITYPLYTIHTRKLYICLCIIVHTSYIPGTHYDGTPSPVRPCVSSVAPPWHLSRPMWSCAARPSVPVVPGRTQHPGGKTWEKHRKISKNPQKYGNIWKNTENILENLYTWQISHVFGVMMRMN